MATLVDTDYVLQPDSTKILQPDGTSAIVFGFHYTETVSGGITNTGSINRITNKVITGALTFSGGITRLTNKVLAGSISFTGTASTTFKKVISMVLDVVLSRDMTIDVTPTNQDD